MDHRSLSQTISGSKKSPCRRLNTGETRADEVIPVKAERKTYGMPYISILMREKASFHQEIEPNILTRV